MANAPRIFFRIGDDAYEALKAQGRRGETVGQTAQRLLTQLLTGSEEIGLKKMGRPKKSRLEDRVKQLEDLILGNGK